MILQMAALIQGGTQRDDQVRWVCCKMLIAS
uniref:Exocyst subunit EXO70 family protein n=1 Tax=Rhizophora mucronata TaxID=61149 RepID=A0A2P2JDV0_RHIMU